MMKNTNWKTKLVRKLTRGVSLLVCGALGSGLFVSGAAQAAGAPITDANPMRMPAVGDYALKILSPTLLELTDINTATQNTTTVSDWNFVSNGSFTAPATSKFTVTVNGQNASIQSIGFKRRPLYAPLNYYDLRIGNYLYLQLSSAIPDGATVQVTNPDGTLWASSKKFLATADAARLSPVIHVNQEGYMPNYTKKAMVGYYLGSMGEMPVSASLGYKIIDANSGATVYSGSLTSRKDVGYTYSPTPYQAVLEADFTAFKTPGEYRLQVPGLGASFPFLIDDGIAALFARTYALGLYHQRCGYGNDFPYTRHTKGVCHSNLVSVPDMTYSAVNSELASMTSDYASVQAAGVPQLKDVNSSLFPFVNKNPINLQGGHHDAGDYSKYTINVAQLAHALVFAVDALPGVKDLDNLGLPESGDGIPDVLQEAKWETDFLVKMQDSDGGFYFLVYPKDRQYEADLSLTGTQLGDPQVVFPKTTHVTAAAVGALAEAGSSPAMKQYFPTQAAAYLAAAKKGWTFLQNAIAKYGRNNCWQKITHYGIEFGHNDELAWAAAALYAATGDTAYQSDLMSHYDPSDPNTRRWSWWRMFEGYGCAVRTYAFAARTGRLQQSQLDPTYLAKCEAEIVACGDDQVRWGKEDAYGSSFPDPNKPNRSAGWYFSVDQTFDVAVAQQISPKQDYIDTFLSNMAYEAGCNPLNVGYLTGVGWKRQRETVNQYAENDRRVLPPSGIPLGSVQAGFAWLYNYGSNPAALTFPSDSASTGMYAPYDKWADTFNTTTEFVNPQQGHSLAAMAYFMAQTSLKTQAWKPVQGTISGLPSSVPAQQNVTATLSAPGVDLSKAMVVWEARDQEPTPADAFTFSAINVGQQWVEAEALLPDGRRVFATTNFNATTATNTPPNSYESAPLQVTADMAALYHLDNGWSDATGKRGVLVPAASAVLDGSNLGWMQNRTGTALHTLDLGDQAVVTTIPNSALYASDTQSISVEAMIYVNAFKAYNRGNAQILSLYQNWNASLQFNENIYYGPRWQCANSVDVAATLTKQVWHHVKIMLDKTGYTMKIDGTNVYTQASSDLANWGGALAGTTTLTLGNFDGWIDEVVVRNVRTSTGTGTTNAAPTVSLTAPTGGLSLTTGANITLTASAADSDGSVTNVEFFQGTSSLGKVTSAPYSLVWSNVAAGTYSLTAKATDNSGASTTSSAVSITVSNVSVGAVATPTFSPVGGTYSNSLTVAMSSSTVGATIYYTRDGSDPTTNSPVYTSAFTLLTNATIKAKAQATGMSDSAIATSSYVFSYPTNGGGTPTNNTPLPAPWVSVDVGSVGFAGSASVSNGLFSVAGSGADIYNTADAFQYTEQPWSGDGEIIARVVSLEATDPWSKAGVMFRESTNANSSYAMLAVTPTNGTPFEYRAGTGASSVHTAGANVGAPQFVRLVRNGNTFSSYVSIDGTNWTATGTQAITMASNVFVGLCVTAHNNTKVNHSVFSDVVARVLNSNTNSNTNTTATLPTPWSSRDVGSVGIAGSAGSTNGTFNVAGSGADIWNTADGFQFVSQPWTGDGEIVARVTGLQTTDPWAKAGVMFRETLNANSSHAMTVVTASNGTAFQRRNGTGAYSTTTAGSYVAAPYWVKVTRSGNLFTSYVSADGSSWTMIGSESITMANSIYVGVVVTAHNNTALNNATFTDVRMNNTGLPTPWLHADVGSVGVKGDATSTNNTFTVKGSGADIWGTADGFHFTYQKWSGDGVVIARVDNLQNTDAWAKAGVMIRESLNTGSTHAMTVVTAANGLAFQRRTSTGGSSLHTSGGSGVAPYWVKIARVGSVFTSSVSADGVNWRVIGSETISMSSTTYVGLVVTAHNNTLLDTAGFSNVRVGTN